MTISPGLVRDAVARKDAPGVRDLLREASEGDRKACARALRPLLRDDPALLRRLFPSVPTGQPLTPENVPPDVPDFMQALLTQIPGALLVTDHRSTPEGREHAEIMALRQSAAFLAAALGLVGGVAEAARLAWDHQSFPGPADQELDAIAGVLADRRPPWLADFVDRHLELQTRFLIGIPAWPLARRLVRLGVIERPAVPGYTILMARALCQRTEAGPRRGLLTTPADELLADPGLLDDEVWRLFTVPDAAVAVQRQGGWAPSLVTLAEQGRLDRDRLLDACLGAFLRDFAPTRVEWYAQLHQHLEPSIPEMSARTDTYLALLGAHSTPAIRLAQQVTGVLLDNRLLDPSRFLAASAPTLGYPRKNIVVAQLKLIDQVIRANPVMAETALAVVAQAFGHERADVQEAALALIARHGGPDGQARADVRRLAQALAPGLASQARRLGLIPDENPEPTAGPGGDSPACSRRAGDPDRAGLADLADRIAALPAAQAEPLHAALRRALAGEVAAPALARPTAGRPLPGPVRDPAELVALFTQLMEDATDALAVERAVAGAVRLGHLPAAQRRELAGPLLRRAETKAREDFYGPFSGCDLAADIACLVLAWGTGWADRGDARDPSFHDRRETIHRSADAEIMSRLQTARIREASAIIGTGRAVELLAEPEYERGVVSPQRLLQRLATWYRACPGTAPVRYDLEGALLRLAPGADEAFWAEWTFLDSATAPRARRIYAEAQRPVALHPVTGVPFRRYRSGGFARLLARADASRGSESASWAALTALSQPVADYFLVYGERWEIRRYDPFVAGWPLLAPWQPELIAAHLLRPLSDGLKPGRTPATTAVSGLAHPGHALGLVGHLALLTGLASAEADTRIAAAGVWTQASLDGRLDPQLAADAIVTGARGQVFKLNRIANGLQHAASQPEAAYRAVEAICRCAPALIETGAPNLHLLLMLAANLAAAVGAPDLPAPLAVLARRRSTSRRAAGAARLAEAAAGPVPDRPAAVTQSLAALVSRAEMLDSV